MFGRLPGCARLRRFLATAVRGVVVFDVPGSLATLLTFADLGLTVNPKRRMLEVVPAPVVCERRYSDCWALVDGCGGTVVDVAPPGVSGAAAPSPDGSGSSSTTRDKDDGAEGDFTTHLCYIQFHGDLTWKIVVTKHTPSITAKGGTSSFGCASEFTSIRIHDDIVVADTARSTCT